jgi:hypothetical protein
LPYSLLFFSRLLATRNALAALNERQVKRCNLFYDFL